MALSAIRQTQEQDIRLGGKSYLMGSVAIWHGGMVCLDSSGYLVPAADTANLSNVIGVADESIDNSGGSPGDLTLRVKAGKAYQFVGVGLTQADVGSVVYVADDQTIRASGQSNDIQAGVLVEYVSATSGKVFIDDPVNWPVVGAGQLSSNAVTSVKINALAVTTAKIAAAAVTGPKLAAGILQVTLLAGADETMAADYTVSGMTSADEVVFVGLLTTAASIASLANITSRYTAGAGVLHTDNNATNQTNNQLMVIWNKLH